MQTRFACSNKLHVLNATSWPCGPRPVSVEVGCDPPAPGPANSFLLTAPNTSSCYAKGPACDPATEYALLPRFGQAWWPMSGGSFPGHNRLRNDSVFSKPTGPEAVLPAPLHAFSVAYKAFPNSGQIFGRDGSVSSHPQRSITAIPAAPRSSANPPACPDNGIPNRTRSSNVEEPFTDVGGPRSSTSLERSTLSLLPSNKSPPSTDEMNHWASQCSMPRHQTSLQLISSLSMD